MQLTRAQVAQRIGRSISTVRRMEQQGLLSPEIGARGVRLYEIVEIDEVCERIERTGRALQASPWTRQPATDPDTVEQLHQQISHQHRQIVSLKSRNQFHQSERNRLQEKLVDAITDFIDIAKPRDRAVLHALERILDLISDFEWE